MSFDSGELNTGAGNKAGVTKNAEKRGCRQRKAVHKAEREVIMPDKEGQAVSAFRYRSSPSPRVFILTPNRDQQVTH